MSKYTPEEARRKLIQLGEWTGDDELQYAKNEKERNKKIDYSSLSPDEARAKLMQMGEWRTEDEERFNSNRKNTSEEEESLLERGLRHSARTVKDIGTGILSLGDFIASPARLALNAGYKLSGSDYQVPQLNEEVS